MAQIQVSNLSFSYEGSSDTIFDQMSFTIDTDWKLGLIGRNGKGKTTFLNLLCELNELETDAGILYQPFETLSCGERTKLMLAVLFSGENDFLLIDEPTNHLDQRARESVKQYLHGKKSYILVSHDRDLLDACIDHVLVLNRQTIEVQSGNFSSWWENKMRKDAFSLAENEKHIKDRQREN